MTSRSRFRSWIAVATLGLLFVALGVTQAYQGDPYLELTTSTGSWSVDQGSAVTLRARVLPDGYRTVSRIEMKKNGSVVNTCWNQNTCSYTVDSMVNGTLDIQAVGYDTDGRIFSTPTTQLTSRNQNDWSSPSVSLTINKTETSVDTGSDEVVLTAHATDSHTIRYLKVVRLDNSDATVTSECFNQTNDCTLTIRPHYNNNDRNKTYTYEAQAQDEFGNTGYSGRVSIRINTTSSNDSHYPRISWVDVPSTVYVDRDVTLSTGAHDEEAVDTVTIKVFDQNDNLIRQRVCDTNAVDANCSANFGNFNGYQGKTLRVRVEAVDTDNHSVTSAPYNMYVQSRTQDNTLPQVSVWTSDSSNSLREDQKITVYGRATDTDGVWGLEVRVQPSWRSTPLVKRCILPRNSTEGNCQITVGPFPNRAGQSLKVWTIAWDAKNGKGSNSGETKVTITPKEEKKQPVIESPRSNQVLTNYPRTASLNWSKVSSARSYQIELACDYCNSTSQTYSDPQTFTTSNTWYTTNALAGDNTFRFRVRALLSNGNYGPWSDYRYFKFDTRSYTY